MQLIGQPELNGSNPPDILTNATVARKAKFLQTVAKLYIWMQVVVNWYKTLRVYESSIK